MKRKRCACCGGVFEETDVQVHSSLYGSGGVLICKPCSDSEEREISVKGNDLPELLATYRMTGRRLEGARS
jgi:hypothetical protein